MSNCEQCGKHIKRAHLAVKLELHIRSGLFRLPGIIAQSDSQGCFDFHPACAERELIRTWRAKIKGNL